MPTEAVSEATRHEWRELGFYYDRDDDSKVWRVVGTAAGLSRFGKLIGDYIANPKNAVLSEHEHYGPYMFLEIGTSTEPEIDDHWIAGPLEDLGSLAVLIEEAAPHLEVGGNTSLRPAFAPSARYDLVLHRREESFDPAREDAECW